MNFISNLFRGDREVPEGISSELANSDAAPEIHYCFIRGYMKSGTNWLGNILNLHPEIHVRGEFHFQKIQSHFERLIDARHLYKGKDPDVTTELARNTFETTVRTLMSGYMQKDGVSWVGDRTPSFAWPPTLTDARYFYITRDPRDVVVSRAYHFMNKPHLEAHHEYISSDEVAPHFNRFQENPDYFRENSQYLLTSEAFIRRTFEGWLKSKESEVRAIQEGVAPVFSVRYEDLHTNVEALRAKMYRFLDLDPSLACELGEKTRPGFKNEISNQFYRKGQVGDWRNYWNPLADSVAKELLAEKMVEFGYQWE